MEEEAARLKAEEDAARIAAEAEKARLAEEARAAEEAERARLAEEEARRKMEEEAARLKRRSHIEAGDAAAAAIWERLNALDLEGAQEMHCTALKEWTAGDLGEQLLHEKRTEFDNLIQFEFAKREAREREEKERKERTLAFEMKVKQELKSAIEERNMHAAGQAMFKQKAKLLAVEARVSRQRKEKEIRAREQVLVRGQRVLERRRKQDYLDRELHLMKEQEKQEDAQKRICLQDKLAAALQEFESVEANNLAVSGVIYNVNSQGICITGLKTGSSADRTTLKVGDIICDIGDENVTGLSEYEVFVRMRGALGSTLEIKVSRMLKKVETCITETLVRDVSVPPMHAGPGFSLKFSNKIASVTRVYEPSSASKEGVQMGDVISMINGNFVAGLSCSEAFEMTQGLPGSCVELVIFRDDNGIKQRLELKVVRDYNLTAMPLRSHNAGIGASVQPHASGLKVTSLMKGTSAENSGMMLQDIITVIDDCLICGMEWHLAAEKLSGAHGSWVDLQASRESGNGKQRVSFVIQRDVDTFLMEAVPGITIKSSGGNLIICTVHGHTSAEDQGVLADDILTMIEDDFVIGMPAKDAMDLLAGKLGTSVNIVITRVSEKMKNRLSFEVIRDFNPTRMDATVGARRRDQKAAVLALRFLTQLLFALVNGLV